MSKTATDKHGKKIRIGDTVTERDNPPVVVEQIVKQGNGTVLIVNPAPNPMFPHHFGAFARDCVKR